MYTVLKYLYLTFFRALCIFLQFREMNSDEHLLRVLSDNDLRKSELVEKIEADNELQKAAVATLLERGDSRSWSLLQQVRLVESQLSALTAIEMDRRKLKMDDHLVSDCD